MTGCAVELVDGHRSSEHMYLSTKQGASSHKEAGSLKRAGRSLADDVGFLAGSNAPSQLRLSTGFAPVSPMSEGSYGSLVVSSERGQMVTTHIVGGMAWFVCREMLDTYVGKNLTREDDKCHIGR